MAQLATILKLEIDNAGNFRQNEGVQLEVMTYNFNKNSGDTQHFLSLSMPPLPSNYR